MKHQIAEGLKRTAVICLLKCGDQLLLLKRKNEPNKGLYTPVGGKLDPFETPEAAAVREIREETGIVVDEVAYCGMLIETSPTKYNWTSFVYLSEIDYCEPPTCNEGELSWIAQDKLDTIETPETDLYIYHAILKHTKFNLFAEYNQDLKMISLYEALENKVLM
ncbi:MAG: NUDIX hydrolase [Thalassobius sp.]|nr:NUDIX hydrolase [Thalassovita sp.]